MQKLPSTLSQKIETLRQCAYFTGLADNLLTELAQNTALWRFERDEVLFWQEEPCPGLHIVARGAIKLFKVSPQGREFILRVLDVGASFNEVPVFDHGLNSVNAAALEASEIWLVDAIAIQRAIHAHPEMCQAVITTLSKNLRMLVNMVEELSFYQITHRLARLISQLPDQQSGVKGRLTQDQFAARLGTVREVVARSLRELEHSGAIQIERHQIRVADSMILKQWVEGGKETSFDQD